MSYAGWSWKTGTPRERANVIREHASPDMPRPMTDAELCDLFNLTLAGLIAVLRGWDWKPEYEREAGYARP